MGRPTPPRGTMKVLHVHRIGGIGGSERHLLTLLPALAMQFTREVDWKELYRRADRALSELRARPTMAMANCGSSSSARASSSGVSPLIRV